MIDPRHPDFFRRGLLDRDSFDKHFEETRAEIQRTRSAAVVLSIFSTLFWLAVLGGLGYVAAHFLAKVW